MPTLEITNEGNYIVRTHFCKKSSHDEIHSTYQLMSAGITFLNQNGIEVGDKFSYRLFFELKRQNFVFINGLGVSRIQPALYITSQKHQNTQQIDTYISNDTLAKRADARRGANTVHSDFTKLIGSIKGLNRRGTYFKEVRGRTPLYARLGQGESLLASKAYCLVFYHHEINKIKIYIPPMIQTRCIGSCHLWEVWAFDIPKCINRTIHRWGISIGHPVESV